MSGADGPEGPDAASRAGGPEGPGPTPGAPADAGSSTPDQATGPAHFKQPGWFTRNVFNRIMAGLTSLGIGVYGSRVLEVRGRKSGEWRRTPVNLLKFEGHDYLVAPRGHTQWVRNMRVSGGGRLRIGRRTQEFRAVELPDADKPPLLRAYLKRWAFEVKVFFDGVDADSNDQELLRIAPDHPVFRLENV